MVWPLRQLHRDGLITVAVAVWQLKLISGLNLDHGMGLTYTNRSHSYGLVAPRGTIM
jgi:hypothetical protein